MTDTTSPATHAGTVPTFAMALACGLAVANLYYNQPMLGLIERAFPGDAMAGFVPTATQLGYALGMFLLVPLGDLVERRRLIVLQFLALALTLVAAAMAPSAWMLVAASLLVGTVSSVAQQIVPFAAALAPPNRRGATIGTVMSGLLAGILLSRTFSGFAGEYLGWRITFWLGVPLALLGAALMARSLPRSRPTMSLRYGTALWSMLHLWRDLPSLRRATLTQAALFASFSAFWTILALHLQEPRFALGADVAGLFGIVGLAGITAAPIAGRLSDRSGPRVVAIVGIAASMAAWLVLGFWNAIAGLVAGVVLLDCGMQGTLISNQHVIYALDPAARNRLNTVMVTGMFLGGAFGSAGATYAYAAGGWGWVSAFSGTLVMLSALPQIRARKS